MRAPVVECDNCHVPWVMRLPLFQMSMSGAEVEPSYVFQRDCKCKGAAPTERRDEAGALVFVDLPFDEAMDT